MLYMKTMTRIEFCVSAVLIINCMFNIDVPAQVLPKDYDTLNYRLVGFSVPENRQATGYVLEVHEYFPQDEGGYNTRQLFEKKHTNSRIIETTPAFGKDYMWRVKYLKKKKIIDSTTYHFFSTGYLQYADTTQYRLKVLSNKMQGRFIQFVDATKTAYDLNGNPVWYLPEIAGVIKAEDAVRDLKVTPQNTITFLQEKNAYEIDYNGQLLWKAPNDGRVSGDSIELYHHEFTRLQNGNYMVLGSKRRCRPMPEEFAERTETKGKNCYDILASSIIEYNPNGDIIWHWISDDHFTDEDVFESSSPFSTHMNSFYFDEKNKTIYTSHRNINRIVKIEYPSGKVLAEYGESYTKEKKIYGDGLFYGQHSCKVNAAGDMYLFNNNLKRPKSGPEPVYISSVLIFKEPQKNTDSITKIWEYTCDIDTFSQPFAAGSGSVQELPGRLLNVCMGGSSRIFIVSSSQRLLWNAILQTIANQELWQPVENGYRSYAIENDEFQQLIFKIVSPAGERD